MFLAYLSLGILIVLLLHYALKFFTRAEPATIRKVLRYLFFTCLIIVIFLLLRFGLIHIAAIVSFISVVVPLIARLRNAKLDWDSASTRHGKSGGAASQERMTREEARDILGVDANASKEDIRAAHKRMIQKNHPDQGGTKYLASKINEARDILLKDK